jgi:hypothetical protein
MGEADHALEEGVVSIDSSAGRGTVVSGVVVLGGRTEVTRVLAVP